MAVTKTSTVKLNTGALMPVVSLGTWKSQPGQVEKAVEYALKDAGYIGVDTATAYSNETEVGQGIKASGVSREKIFLTTKLDNDCHGDVRGALEASLSRLDTPYLDLWLMHWPAPMTSPPSDNKPDKSKNWLDTWKEMEKLHKEDPKKLRAIGVSNVSAAWLPKLLDIATVVPAVNQIELHPSLPQLSTVEASTKAGIILTSYSPLGSDKSPLHENAVVKKLADKYNVDAAAILVSFQAGHENRTVLPKSVTPARIKTNAELVNLTPEELKELSKISETSVFRVCNPTWTGWGDLGFDLEGEKKG